MVWISHSQVSQSTDNFCFENLSFWCILSTEVMKFSSIEAFAFLSSIGVSSANQTGLYICINVLCIRNQFIFLPIFTSENSVVLHVLVHVITRNFDFARAMSFQTECCKFNIRLMHGLVFTCVDFLILFNLS